MDKLKKIALKYCEQRNLLFAVYWSAMTNDKELDAKTVETLIRYHKEWMK
jgi:hypothetical protein